MLQLAHMIKYTAKLILLIIFILCNISAKNSFGQYVNNVTIYPPNPTSNDTVMVVSNFSYFGNCSFGLVNTQIMQLSSVINILPEYCGFGDSTLCNAMDTFSLGVLPIGNYTINIEYHQGTICGGGFDTIIAYFDTTVQIATITSGSLISKDEKITIFPNPTNSYIKIKSKEPIKAIKLFDKAGKETRVVINNESIDIRSLSPGLYFLKIQLKNGAIITKEIIKNNTR